MIIKVIEVFKISQNTFEEKDTRCTIFEIGVQLSPAHNF